MKPYVAVITGDIVRSSDYEYQYIVDTIKGALSLLLTSKDGLSFEISRGDSFQFFLPHAQIALEKVLGLRAYLRILNLADQQSNYGTSKKRNPLDVRVSIGISQKDYHIGASLGESIGEAFVLSGRGLDIIKQTQQNITLHSEDLTWSKWINLCLHIAEQSISSWTPEQAEAIVRSLDNKTQQVIAQEIAISQAAVQQRLKSANWPAIKQLLAIYADYFS